MSYQITSESYGRRLPKITATADSTDDLATLGTNFAEGSTCVIGSTTYSLDKVQGWIEPGSGGGASALVISFSTSGSTFTADKTFDEVAFAILNGVPIFAYIKGSPKSALQVDNFNLFEEENVYSGMISFKDAEWWSENSSLVFGEYEFRWSVDPSEPSESKVYAVSEFSVSATPYSP